MSPSGRLFLALISILPCLQLGASEESIATADICCGSLEAAGLGNALFYPSSQKYIEREASYWSTGAPLGPWCIVQPSSTEEVSRVVKALTLHAATSSCSFAVRSGGQGQANVGNDISNGVTIDLGLMSSVVYHQENNTVSLGPGGRWKNVYPVLDKLGISVAGGRAAEVGVAGLLLGGGNAFHSLRRGWACDGVRRYEVVLADGSVVTADENANADLFIALKGGSANFGIVTRFDLEAFPAKPLWGGTIVYPDAVMDELVDAFVKFADALDTKGVDDSSTIIFQTYTPAIKGSLVVASILNMDGIEWDEPHKDFFTIQPHVMETLRMTNITDLTNELVLPTYYEDIWGTLTFRNDPRVITKAVELHDRMVAEVQALSHTGNFSTLNMFQPLPVALGRLGKGRNVLGLDRLTETHVLWLAGLHVNSREQPELSAVGRTLLQNWVDAVAEYARGLGLDGDFVYMNYASTAAPQDPFRGYGEENAALIAAAARKFDSEGVFQTRVPGGFKISTSFPDLYKQAKSGRLDHEAARDEL